MNILLQLPNLHTKVTIGEGNFSINHSSIF
jgi:hypothetical protein